MRLGTPAGAEAHEASHGRHGSDGADSVSEAEVPQSPFQQHDFLDLSAISCASTALLQQQQQQQQAAGLLACSADSPIADKAAVSGQVSKVV